MKKISVRLENELYDRFINFLDEYAEGDTLSDRLRNFINSSIQPTKEEFLKNIQTPQQKPDLEKAHPESCPFYALREDGKIECGRLLSKKGKTILMSPEACASCWSRRLYIQRQKQPSTSENDVSNATPLNCKRGLRIFPSNMGVPCYQICKLKYPVIYSQCKARKQIESANSV